jgi:hypothetical protein
MRRSADAIAGACGPIALVVMTAGWTLGGLSQPDAYSSARDDISYLGALTAERAWLYNQLAANLGGLLVLALAVGLWRALSPDVLGRMGALALAVAAVGTFLDGIFRLDCRSIDPGCKNDSWHAHAHKIESGITAGATLVAPVILAFAFRRSARWRTAWLPTLLVVPTVLAANVVFSIWGDGAATRAGTTVVFVWFAYVGSALVQNVALAEHPRVVLDDRGLGAPADP